MEAKIVTLNCFALPFLGRFVRERLSIVGQELNRIRPNVICFQEVFLKDHINILQKNLTHLPHTFFAPRKFLQLGGGLVVFSQTPILNKKFQRFKNQGLMLSFSLSDRIADKGFIFVETNNFLLLNTHLVANYNHGYSSGSKLAKIQNSQLSQLIKFIQTGDFKNKPLILAGDFNFPPNSFLYKKLVESLEIIDLTSNAGSSTTPESLYLIPFKNKLRNKIDYIFLSQNVPFKEAKCQYLFTSKIKINNRLETYLSDHFAILATIHF